MTSAELVFSRLHLPRPLELVTVTRFLGRLASDRAAPRVVLEVRADQHGIRHLLGCRATDVHALRHLLSDLMPGTVLTTPGQGEQQPRPVVKEVGRLHVQPAGLPLRSDTAEATTRALLSAMATQLRADEVVAVQVVLGPRHAPKSVPTNAPDPATTLAQILTRGDRPASADTRSRVKERLSQAGFAATIRFGAASPDPGRRRRFLMGLLSAISTAQSPGVRINLTREDAKRLTRIRLRHEALLSRVEVRDRPSSCRRSGGV